jgi:sterol desaturase/sphingolipid hydroxylase (fatty acid hydroxylase superfamily)
MQSYIDVFINGYKGYAGYLWNDISNPTWNSYFYWLILVSMFFLVLEVVIPWRKKQPALRKDFWLDVFYMFFNFFLFSLIIYNAASDVVVNLFNNGIKGFFGGFDLQAMNPMNSWPIWAILITGFFVRDFVQWWVHRLLHKSDRLWEFHKVHHSVEEMGFAAHLRYHWMENIVYRTIEYIPLALLGIGLHDFFIIHIFTLAWGHYNHSNISIDSKITGGIFGGLLGIVAGFGLAGVNLLSEPSLIMSLGVVVLFILIGAFVLSPIMKKLFNSPEMHIWHHSYNLPEDRRTGVNFGLTLAIWDYIFGTAYIPSDGREIRLGFPGIEEFPHGFVGQNLNGFSGKHK